MSTNAKETTGNARADACAYILHMLLQRTELQEPGFLAAMMDGVLSDWNNVPPTTPGREKIDQTFDETLRILRLANDQLQE